MEIVKGKRKTLVRKYKAGYELHSEWILGEQYGTDDFIMINAYTPTSVG